MGEFFQGAVAFFPVALVVVVIMEVSHLFEELFTVRAQLRKGFVGAKSNVFRIFSRHLLRLLRMSGTGAQNIGAGFKFIIIFLAVGLLPVWPGTCSWARCFIWCLSGLSKKGADGPSFW